MLNTPGRRVAAGFTLVELLVVMVMMGIFAAAMVKLLLRQQRFYNSTSEVIQTRQQIRQATFMLPADLRGVSRQGGDLAIMTDSSIEIRSVFGSSVVCLNTGAGWISTVPLTLATGAAMTNWKIKPAANDSVAVYDDGPTISTIDDSWRLSKITLVTPITTSTATTGCPTSTRLTQAVDMVTTNPSYQFTLSPVPTATIRSGASVRFFRRVHYSLWKWPTDGQWYLTYFDCVPARVPLVCTTPQPIAGPLRPYAAPGSFSGLEFTYYDSTGAVTANKALVARISVVVRAQGQTTISLAGGASIPLRDSLRIEVALRNRN